MDGGAVLVRVSAFAIGIAVATGMVIGGYSVMYQTGYGPGMNGPGWYGRIGNHALTVDEVRDYLGLWLAMKGNHDLELGTIVVENSDTIEANIVRRRDATVVQKIRVNRHTGFYNPISSQNRDHSLAP